MTRVARAHFDGKVIVPDEPIDLPINAPLEIRCTPVQDEGEADASALIEERLRGLAKATGCLAGPTLPEEALRRENLYE